MSSLAAGGIRPALARILRRHHGFAGSALLVLSGCVTGAALAVAGARVLRAPVLVAAMLVGGGAAGAAAAFAIPLKPTDAPKHVTVPIGKRELERFVVRRWVTAAVLLGIVVAALLVRLWHFNDVGYNSDEAVYSGQGAGIARDPQLAPLLPGLPGASAALQSVLAIGYELHQGDWFGRAAAIELRRPSAYLATFELGRLLYGGPRGADRCSRPGSPCPTT